MKKNIGRIIIFTLFILFVALYFTQTTGYYEYENKQTTELTKEQIKKFEEDIKEGKDIDTTEYINLNRKNYNNSLSKASLKVSIKIEELFNKGMDKLFRVLETTVNS